MTGAQANISATVVALLLAVSLAACGDAAGPGNGSESNAASSSAQPLLDVNGQHHPAPEPPVVVASSLSRSQFVQRANVACRAKRRGLYKRLIAYAKDNPADDGSLAEAYRGLLSAVLLPIIEAEFTAVAELGFPAGDRKAIESILESSWTAIGDAAGSPSIHSVAEVESRFARTAALAQRYGIGACGKTASVGTER